MRLRAPTRFALAIFVTAWAGSATRTHAQQRQQQKQPTTRQAAAAPQANDQEQAVRAAVAAFVKAFEARDAKAMAGLWTSGGEYRNDRGVHVTGRENLEKAFAAVFARSPEIKAQVETESVHFLSSDAAVDEGTAMVRHGAVAPASRAKYRALIVREDGKWRVAQLTESSEIETSVADLGWLVGSWKSASGQGADITTEYSWTPSKKFLRVKFTVKEKAQTLSGDQMIGVDPDTGQIRSWSFEANGGVGEADWTRDGDQWVLEATGSLPDGRVLTEKNILTRINEDTFTWQSIDRMLDDRPLPELAPVKVTRIKN